jgi:hypothetical protein
VECSQGLLEINFDILQHDSGRSSIGRKRSRSAGRKDHFFQAIEKGDKPAAVKSTEERKNNNPFA